MENDHVLAKKVTLLINIILLFEYKACCFFFHETFLVRCSSHHPFLVFFSSSFFKMRSQIKYHPERLEPLLTAMFHVLTEYSVYFPCCITCNYKLFY